MASQIQEKANPQVKKLLDEYKSSVKSKGTLTEWSDAFLIKTRDRFRTISRKTRGAWTLEFYEVIQKINKESFKRDLD